MANSILPKSAVPHFTHDTLTIISTPLLSLQRPSLSLSLSPLSSMKNPSPIASDLKAIVSIARTRRTKVFAYGFLFAFVACTAFLAFNPSSNSSSPWFSNLFTSSSTNSLKASIAPYRSQVSSFFSHLFPNSSSPSNIGTAVSVPKLVDGGGGSSKDPILGSGSGRIGALKENQTRSSDSPKNGVPDKSQVKNVDGVKKDGATEVKSESGSGVTEEKQVGNGSKGSGVTEEKQVKNGSGSGKNGVEVKKGEGSEFKNKTESESGVTEEKQVKNGSASGKNGAEIKKDGNLKAQKQNESGVSNKNQTSTTQIPQKGTGISANSQKDSKASSTQKGQKGIVGEGAKVSNLTDALSKGNESAKVSSNGNGMKKVKWIEDMIGCDIFHGHWVKDESYPLYPEGSCPHIDEPFDCYHNGRPDRSYQKLRWQPSGCNIPRLNAKDMLERLRGKRLVFVGDSLNRNMWESLVCVLRNSLKDKKKVFEASGRHEFRTEGSYSFLFKDYKATVEFFRSPFLVQEWEMPNGNGTKETLRLDIIERSSSKYKDAHFIIFNTGHWWTHEKTSKGKDYYQEGNRVYSELNVVDAFHKALNTWAKWVDANVNPTKSFVFFRGYSASHFSGGQWNSGGACDKETEPIKNENYLSSYPTKMSVLESVIKGMKTPVSYLNITRMTDYRKDAHPSVYRKQSLTEEERKDPLRFQDCSHWCLPGVPDSWNELLYAQLIIKQYQMGQ